MQKLPRFGNYKKQFENMEAEVIKTSNILEKKEGEFATRPGTAPTKPIPKVEVNVIHY